jgi:hypothetical protein
MTLTVFADQDAESHASAPVSLVAQLMQADYSASMLGCALAGPDGIDA